MNWLRRAKKIRVAIIEANSNAPQRAASARLCPRSVPTRLRNNQTAEIGTIITAVSLVKVATRKRNAAQAVIRARLPLPPTGDANGVIAARSNKLCSSSGVESVYVFSTSGPARTRLRPAGLWCGLWGMLQWTEARQEHHLNRRYTSKT